MSLLICCSICKSETIFIFDIVDRQNLNVVDIAFMHDDIGVFIRKIIELMRQLLTS